LNLKPEPGKLNPCPLSVPKRTKTRAKTLAFRLVWAGNGSFKLLTGTGNLPIENQNGMGLDLDRFGNIFQFYIWVSRLFVSIKWYPFIFP
jgi:hypothetical protein